MSENLREIINGAQLPQYIGQKVSVTGLVTQINPNGLTFDMKTTDDVSVKVNMKRPRKDLLEGYVEVHGLAQNKVIICEELVEFPIEEPKDGQSVEFDIAAHNTLCQLLQGIPNLWKIE